MELFVNDFLSEKLKPYLKNELDNVFDIENLKYIKKMTHDLIK